MRHVDSRPLLVFLAAVTAVVLVGLSSWNTLAPLVGAPQAQLRHAVAALALFAVLRSLLLPAHSRRRRRPRRTDCAEWSP